MGGFGDVLRGLGSVLNPQVAQGLEQERMQGQQQAAQQQQFMLGQLVKGVESGAIDPAKLPPQLQGMVGVSPEAQARVEALRNEKAYREALGGLAGNPTEDQMAQLAVKHGKPEVAAAYAKAKEDRALRVQQAAENNQLRRDKLEQDNKLALERITDSRQRAEWEQQYKRDRLALDSQNAGIQQQMRMMGLEIQRDRAQQGNEQKTQQNVTKLGTALEKAGLPEIDGVLGAVETALQKVPNLAEYLTGPKSLLPDMAVPDDIKAGRQALEKLFNITLKNRSGAAVTSQELERLKSEFGRGAFKTPQQIKTAVEQARGVITNHYASIAAGFGKDALQQYNSNAQELGARQIVPTQAAPAAAVPPPPPGFKVNP